MHSGDIDRLKEYTLCCFEYLLSKIHGLSLEKLLWEFEVICSNILDADILLVQSTLKIIADIVLADPMSLAGEFILRLKNIRSSSSIAFVFLDKLTNSMSISVTLFLSFRLFSSVQ